MRFSKPSSFWFESGMLSGSAQTSGRFDAEILPVSIPQKKGGPFVFAKDESVRAETTADVLRIISGAPTDIQAALEAVLDRAARLCGADAAQIFRVDAAFASLSRYSCSSSAPTADSGPEPGGKLPSPSGGVAQLAERYVRNVEVGGSNPLTSTP